MSSHRRRVKHFGRKFKARKALFRGLVSSLVEHGRIATTVDKAKELRRYVEKAITLGKKGDLATRRLLLSRYPNVKTVETIMSDLANRFKARPGGYTRIIKLGPRPGDMSEMAFIEFIDHKYDGQMVESKGGQGKQAAKNSTASKSNELAEDKLKKTKAMAGKKKSLARKQKKARIAARA